MRDIKCAFWRDSQRRARTALAPSWMCLQKFILQNCVLGKKCAFWMIRHVRNVLITWGSKQFNYGGNGRKANKAREWPFPYEKKNGPLNANNFFWGGETVILGQIWNFEQKGLLLNGFCPAVKKVNLIRQWGNRYNQKVCVPQCISLSFTFLIICRCFEPS